MDLSEFENITLNCVISTLQKELEEFKETMLSLSAEEVFNEHRKINFYMFFDFHVTYNGILDGFCDEGFSYSRTAWEALSIQALYDKSLYDDSFSCCFYFIKNLVFTILENASSPDEKETILRLKHQEALELASLGMPY